MTVVLFKPAKERARGKAGRWHFKFHPGDGKWKYRVGCTDKGATLEGARRDEADAFRRLRGYVDPKSEELAEADRVPLLSHHRGYAAWLRAQHRAESHIGTTLAYLTRAASSIGWTRLSEIRAELLQAHLSARSTEKETGARTHNASVKAWRAFTRWCVAHGKLPSDPLSTLKLLNEATDRRRLRRDLSAAERERLITAAEKAPPASWVRGSRRWTMSGRDRAALYSLMLYTGLRLGEASSLIRASFDLDARIPVLTVAAAYSKHRREDLVPLPSLLVKRLKPWLASKGKRKGPLWPLPYKPYEVLLKPDLDLAKIATGADGKGVVDFHSLRHDFITGVAAVAPSFGAVQAAARHRSPEMTARYIHAHLADEHALVNRAFPGDRERVQQLATGTHGAEPKPPAVTTTQRRTGGHPDASPSTVASADSLTFPGVTPRRSPRETPSGSTIASDCPAETKSTSRNRGGRIRTADLLTPSQPPSAAPSEDVSLGKSRMKRAADGAEISPVTTAEPPDVPTTRTLEIAAAIEAARPETRAAIELLLRAEGLISGHPEPSSA